MHLGRVHNVELSPHSRASKYGDLKIKEHTEESRITTDQHVPSLVMTDNVMYATTNANQVWRYRPTDSLID